MQFTGFRATIVGNGLTAWNLLKQNSERQLEILKKSPTIQRDVEYFKENIAEADSAEELVEDPRLLRTALAAYGLEEEFSKKAYIRKILESDLGDQNSFANRTGDPRWREFARSMIKPQAEIPSVFQTGFPSRIAASYLEASLPKAGVKPEAITQHNELSAAFRTTMKTIKSSFDLVNNKDAMRFIAQTYDIDIALVTKEDSQKYLTAVNEDNVPEEWRQARAALQLFDKGKPNDGAGAERVIRDRVSALINNAKEPYDALSETLSSAQVSDLRGQETAFRSAMAGITNVDQFLANADALAYVKAAFDQTDTTVTNAQIKTWLTATDPATVPKDWQAARSALPFKNSANTGQAITPEVIEKIVDQRLKTEVKSAKAAPEIVKNELQKYKTFGVVTAQAQSFELFKTAMRGVDDAFEAVNTPAVLNQIKFTYGLTFDRSTKEQVETYLTAVDKSKMTPAQLTASADLIDLSQVPAEWREAREKLSFFDETLTGRSQDIAHDSDRVLRKIERDYYETYLNSDRNFKGFNDPESKAQFIEKRLEQVLSVSDLTADRPLLRELGKMYNIDLANKSGYELKKIIEGDAPRPKEGNAEGWRKFTDDFTFSVKSSLQTGDEGFADKTLEDFYKNVFSQAVGEQDETLRLALNFENRVAKLASFENVDNFGWFTVMGEPPLRAVFEAAFNLPSSFGGLELDFQREILEKRAESFTGSSKLSSFKDPEHMRKFIQVYLTQSQIASSPAANAAALFG